MTQCFTQGSPDYLRLYLEAWKQHGDMVRFGARGQSLYLAVHPDAVRHVLRDHARNYRKPAVLLKNLQRLFGKGLFTTEGATWQLCRHWAQPPFVGKVRRMIWHSAVVQALRETLSQWRSRASSEAADLREEMTVVVLRAICYSFFGTQARLDFRVFAGAVGAGLRYLQDQMGRPFCPPLWIPSLRNGQLLRARQILGDGIAGLLQDYRAARPAPDGLLSQLLASQPVLARGESGEPMLRELLLTLIVAAAESLGTALCWTWLLLARHSAVRQKLLDELESFSTEEQAMQSPYARMVFQETLRLYPTGWVQPRQALADDTLQGYFVPRGTIIVLAQYLTHRHPDFWPEPEAFLPERFAAGRRSEIGRRAYFPFGLGSHRCPGEEFALFAGPLILASLAHHYSLEPITGVIPEPKKNSFFLEPANRVEVLLRERPDRSAAFCGAEAEVVPPARERSCLTP